MNLSHIIHFLAVTSSLAFTTVDHVTLQALRNPSVALQMSDEAKSSVDDGSKVCLVTGSSRGIGKCIAFELAKQGNTKIVINDIAPMMDEANAVVEEIREMGVDAIALAADCSNQEDIKKLFKEVINHYGRCDVLVNNAGITRDNNLIRMKPEQWQQVIDVNLSGVFYASQEFIKQAIKSHIAGCIVNIASVVGQIGNPGQANYASAKAGVIGLTKSNAKEFGSRGIRVNAVCPGYIRTPMT